jgi:hypothetical protein
MPEFNSYMVRHFSGTKEEAHVECLLDGDPVGKIVFVGKKRLAKVKNVTEPELTVYMPINRFREVLMTLRHERPLFIGASANTGVGAISSGDEPVGEEE